MKVSASKKRPVRVNPVGYKISHVPDCPFFPETAIYLQVEFLNTIKNLSEQRGHGDHCFLIVRSTMACKPVLNFHIMTGPCLYPCSIEMTVLNTEILTFQLEGAVIPAQNHSMNGTDASRKGNCFELWIHRSKLTRTGSPV